MDASSSAAATTEGGSEPISAFKQKLTQHKRRGNDPNRLDDVGEMIDASQLLLATDGNAELRSSLSENDRLYPLDVTTIAKEFTEEVYEGPVFGIRGFPGCYLAPQAIDEALQLELAYRAVAEWCEEPHRTNIDLQPAKASERVNGSGERMWTLWKQQRKNLAIAPSAKKHKSHHHSPSKNEPETKYYRSFKKLSWATLGYHYNWTKRSYCPDEKSPMPPLLAQVSTRFAKTSLLLEQSSQTNGKRDFSLTFNPTASIVNYYNAKSYMGGHQDDLELALDKPIASISLGLPAVFLLGGKSKEETPVVAILLRPGDVLCMGGACRLSFHAMARIIPLEAAAKIPLPTLSPFQGRLTKEVCPIEATDRDVAEEELQEVRDYLQHHRININVRQVYPDDETVK